MNVIWKIGKLFQSVTLHHVDMPVNSSKIQNQSLLQISVLKRNTESILHRLTWDVECLMYRSKGLQFYKQQLVVSFHLLDAIVTMNSVGLTAWQHTWMLNILSLCTIFFLPMVFRDTAHIQNIWFLCYGALFCYRVNIMLAFSHSDHAWQNVTMWCILDNNAVWSGVCFWSGLAW